VRSTGQTGVRLRSLKTSKRRTRVRIARLESKLNKCAVAGHPYNGVMTEISEFILEGHVSLIS
jgi:ribosomal protein L34E